MISRPTAIRVWSRSGGQCAFHDCDASLDLAGEDRLIGNVAHIIASSDDGPRSDAALPQEQRDHPDNLVLLCPNHHALVDASPERYTVEDLRALKTAHEGSIATQLARGQVWRSAIGELLYVNLRKLLLDPDALGCVDPLLVDMVLDGETLRDLSGPAAMQALALCERLLPRLEARAVPLSSALTEGSIGARVSFATAFRTKHLRAYIKRGSLTGDQDVDPHLYITMDQRRIMLPLDPAWITSSTAIGFLSSGIVRLTGVGTLRAVSATRATISPAAFGLDNQELVRQFRA